MLSSPSSCTNIQCPGMKKGPATLAHADRQMYTHMNYAAVTRTKQANPLVSKLFHWTLLHREKKAAREYAIIFHSQTSSLAQLNHTDQWKFKPVTDLNTHTSRHQHMHTFKVTINITLLAVCCKLRVASCELRVIFSPSQQAKGKSRATSRWNTSPPPKYPRIHCTLAVKQVTAMAEVFSSSAYTHIPRNSCHQNTERGRKTERKRQREKQPIVKMSSDGFDSTSWGKKYWQKTKEDQGRSEDWRDLINLTVIWRTSDAEKKRRQGKERWRVAIYLKIYIWIDSTAKVLVSYPSMYNWRWSNLVSRFRGSTSCFTIWNVTAEGWFDRVYRDTVSLAANEEEDEERRMAMGMEDGKGEMA